MLVTFLCYAQRFDIIPQLNQVSPTQGPHVEPTSGMYILKRAKRHDGTILGDVVPLANVRALVSLIPVLYSPPQTLPESSGLH